MLSQSSGFCSLRRFAALALRARLIARLTIEDYLLETAAPPAKAATAAIRRNPALRRRAGLARTGRASAAWNLSAAQSACAGPSPWSLRLWSF